MRGLSLLMNLTPVSSGGRSMKTVPAYPVGAAREIQEISSGSGGAFLPSQRAMPTASAPNPSPHAARFMGKRV